MTNAFAAFSNAKARATNPLFNRKYEAAKATSGTNISGSRTAESPCVGASAKYRCPAAHIEIAAEETLKTTLIGSLAARLKRREATRMSNATVIVPAHVPKRRTEAKTNVSDTESRAGSFGTLIVNEPLRRVRAANGSQSDPIGSCLSIRMHSNRTASPAAETKITYE